LRSNYVRAWNVAVGVEHHGLAAVDRPLLWSDGLTDLVWEVKIAALLEAYLRPEDACRPGGSGPR
jgi:hypothetical protein